MPGWVGRLCAAEVARGASIIWSNLGVWGDTTVDLAARWEREAEARLPAGEDGRLVVLIGFNDHDDASGVGPRVAAGRSLSVVAAVLAAAAAAGPPSCWVRCR